MRKIIIIIMSLLLFVSCNKEYDFKVEIDRSKIFSKKEVEDAIDVVSKEFKKDEYILIERVYYNEEKSNEMKKLELQGDYKDLKDEDILVLYVDFNIDEKATLNTGWIPGDEHKGYGVTLIRNNEDSKWEIINCGYA